MKRFSLTSVLLGALAGTLVGATGTVALLLALGAPPPGESAPATHPPASSPPPQAPRRSHPTPTPTTRPDPSVTALASADATQRVDPWRARHPCGLRIPDFVRSQYQGSPADCTPQERLEADGDSELRIPDFMRARSVRPAVAPNRRSHRGSRR